MLFYKRSIRIIDTNINVYWTEVLAAIALSFLLLTLFSCDNVSVVNKAEYKKEIEQQRALWLADLVEIAEKNARGYAGRAYAARRLFIQTTDDYALSISVIDQQSGKPNTFKKVGPDPGNYIYSAVLDILFEQEVPPVGIAAIGNVFSHDHKIVLEEKLFSRSAD